jgi:hypothetical protein
MTLASVPPAPSAARFAFFYFNDDGQLVATRVGNWKTNFCEQRTEGTLAVWRDPFTCLRAPTMFNLRMDPYERAEITSDTWNDWSLRHVRSPLSGSPRLVMLSSIDWLTIVSQFTTKSPARDGAEF